MFGAITHHLYCSSLATLNQMRKISYAEHSYISIVQVMHDEEECKCFALLSCHCCRAAPISYLQVQGNFETAPSLHGIVLPDAKFCNELNVV